MVNTPLLMSVHLNDNGINSMNQHGEENDIKLELLDIFGIDESILDFNFAYVKNRDIKFPDTLREKVLETLSKQTQSEKYLF